MEATVFEIAVDTKRLGKGRVNTLLAKTDWLPGN